MVAVEGVYENGSIALSQMVPVSKTNVIVVFPDIKGHDQPSMSHDDKLALFEELSGSIGRDIDYKAERLSALDEKYVGAH